jgi:hypothetical protein
MDTLEERHDKLLEHAERAIDRSDLTLSPRHLTRAEIEEQVQLRALTREHRAQLVAFGALAPVPELPESRLVRD